MTSQLSHSNTSLHTLLIRENCHWIRPLNDCFPPRLIRIEDYHPYRKYSHTSLSKEKLKIQRQMANEQNVSPDSATLRAKSPVVYSQASYPEESDQQSYEEISTYFRNRITTESEETQYQYIDQDEISLLSDDSELSLDDISETFSYNRERNYFRGKYFSFNDESEEKFSNGKYDKPASVYGDSDENSSDKTYDRSSVKFRHLVRELFPRDYNEYKSDSSSLELSRSRECSNCAQIPLKLENIRKYLVNIVNQVFNRI